MITKDKVLTFLCALWPGGGYMFLGMMRKGALAMTLFVAMCGVAVTIGWNFLGFFLPVIWCYCFFDTFHMNKRTVEERKAADREAWDGARVFCSDDPIGRLKGREKLVGIVIVLLAIYTVVYGVLLPFFRWGENFYWVRLTLQVIPTAVMAVLLFMVGKHMIDKNKAVKDDEMNDTMINDDDMDEADFYIKEEAIAEAETVEIVEEEIEIADKEAEIQKAEIQKAEIKEAEIKEAEIKNVIAEEVAEEEAIKSAEAFVESVIEEADESIVVLAHEFSKEMGADANELAIDVEAPDEENQSMD